MEFAMRIGFLLAASVGVGAYGIDSRAAPGAAVYFDVSNGAHPHDVAATPVAGGPVYYTAQSTGKLGILDPKSGKFEEIALECGCSRLSVSRWWLSSAPPSRYT